MSGNSDGSICPNCGEGVTVYTDHWPLKNQENKIAEFISKETVGINPEERHFTVLLEDAIAESVV